MDTDGVEHVHVGRDGWLFLTAGSNNVVGQFSRSRLMARRVRGWKRLVLARVRGCERLGAQYLHVIVPEKLTVYDHKLSDSLTVKVRLSPALRLRRALIWHPKARRACLDLVGAFRAQRDTRDLYYRTDSHWSFEGCETAYRLICAACGAVPRAFSPEPQDWIERAGDLGGKLTPPRAEPWPIRRIQRDAVRVHESPIVSLRERTGRADTLHVGAHVIYRNDAPGADRRKVVLFGDSYAHFAPIMLTALVAETFAEVHFVWSSSLDWGYLARVRPDLVIGQVAERFMFQMPDDRFDLAAYAAERFGPELAAAQAAEDAARAEAEAAAAAAAQAAEERAAEALAKRRRWRRKREQAKAEAEAAARAEAAAMAAEARAAENLAKRRRWRRIREQAKAEAAAAAKAEAAAMAAEARAAENLAKRRRWRRIREQAKAAAEAAAKAEAALSHEAGDDSGA